MHTALLDVTHRLVESPIGRLFVAATPAGVVRLAFEGDDHESALAVLTARFGPGVLSAPDHLEAAARELDEYFAGSRRSFDVAVDLQLAQGFRRRVLDHLVTIPYGSTQSYSAVAMASGSPAAVRAVGSACATNPVPVIVPCHRVVRSDGVTGQYLGGLDAKRTLLALEEAGSALEAGQQPSG